MIDWHIFLFKRYTSHHFNCSTISNAVEDVMLEASLSDGNMNSETSLEEDQSMQQKNVKNMSQYIKMKATILFTIFLILAATTTKL